MRPGAAVNPGGFWPPLLCPGWISFHDHLSRTSKVKDGGDNAVLVFPDFKPVLSQCILSEPFISI